MSQMSMFFEEYMNEILLKVNTLAPARVMSYNIITKRADLQPLFLIANKDGSVYKQSPIYNIPVPKHCQSDMRSGVLVFYMSAQRSLAEMNGANFIDPDSHDFFSPIDAVVMAVIDG
ncbi:hypothetical protein [Metabacillus fastidiosus]|uniref:hypothetical protein n=1 Tax=Metabacillus fastidiosus TaxID=1458 RepID=UPI002E1A561F|nr:hypothetical protein [Metabacillus fastidiosus]